MARVRLLVDAPSGIQELISVEPSGFYFDISRVLWDERRDGPFPAPLNQVGGLIRVGNILQFSAAKKSADDARKIELAAPEVAMLARLQRLRTADLNTVPLEFRVIIEDLVHQIAGGVMASSRTDKVKPHKKKCFLCGWFSWLPWC